MRRDVIGRFDESLPGTPMLHPLIKQGRAVMQIDLEESRRWVQRELKKVPEELRALESGAQPCPVSFSERLEAEFKKVTTTLSSG
jgi:nicotinate phosphoribosyltransferase